MTEFVEMDPSGRYGRLNKILGKGAMKTVYQAFDRVLGMEVAWNQVMLNNALRSPDELERLHTEVHLLKNLKHDAIMRFHTSWIQHEHKTFNFITEMFTSGTLTDYRKLYTQVDMRAIKNWARQILCGLVYLHSRDPPVIHRDLKCDNIFVNGHLGQVKIGDLGLAAILRDSQRAHSVIGTPEFMAPELYEEEYNELVDVYSFGMCLLEMVTTEFPYSECLNTAQIYKKVTSGKKPNAYYRIEDMEAQIFIGKCLQVASKRLAAHELLLDPFLTTEDSLSPGSQQPSLQMYFEKPKNHLSLMVPVRRNDMTITGKMTLEDNTIDLKVQIADANGQARNILFPFDIMNDTAMDVAVEMVKELDIPDRSPFEISEMIEQAVSALLPGWRDHNLNPFQFPYQIHSTEQSVDEQEEDDNDDDDDDDNASKKAYSPPSLLSFDSSSPVRLNRGGGEDDDRSCQSSYGHFNYSGTGCSYNSEVVYSLLDENRSGKMEEEATVTPPSQWRNMGSSTRYYPEKKALPKGTYHKQQPISSRSTNNKVQSFMDIRSQLLHQALTQALKKKHLKTVGAVEDIGFQVPRET